MHRSRRSGSRFTARFGALLLAFLFASAGSLLSAGAAGETTITITPDRELSNPIGDPQYVRVNWSHVAPGTLVYARQCTEHPTTIKDCSEPGFFGPGLITAGATGSGGGGTVVFPVYEGEVNGSAPGQSGGPPGFNCDYKHACSIAVFTDGDATNVKTAAVAPIQFAFPTSACPAPSGPSVVGSVAAGPFRAMITWEGTACRSPHD
ncbi:MAG: hypothetical protein M3O84_00575, partial [Actinomycetota bacterium]|nr:hypothetical protein [Actinomycetota bacterium]